ncbi:MAG: hypothetical protein WC332_02330 [Clostridia bacterium]|jgi:hypothetical protein
MTWDKRTSLDMENESMEGLACKITAIAFILVGAGLIIGSWLWL